MGLGVILYQNQDGINEIIGYASRSLTKTECKYLAQKLEFLALKWAIKEQLQEYLSGNNFVIYTDNNPLTCYITQWSVCYYVAFNIMSRVPYMCIN